MDYIIITALLCFVCWVIGIIMGANHQKDRLEQIQKEEIERDKRFKDSPKSFNERVLERMKDR